MKSIFLIFGLFGVLTQSASAKMVTTQKQFAFRLPTTICSGTLIQGILVAGTGGTELKHDWDLISDSTQVITNVKNLSPNGMDNPASPKDYANLKSRFCTITKILAVHPPVPFKPIHPIGFYYIYDIHGYADCGDRVQDSLNVGKQIFLGCEGTYDETVNTP